MKTSLSNAWSWPWLSKASILLIVVGAIGCHKSEPAKTAPSEIVKNTNDEAPAPEPTNLARSHPGEGPLKPDPSQSGARTEDSGPTLNLPDFTTYLVSVPPTGSISADTISDLSSVCSQLKEQISIPEVNAITECHVRSDNPLWAGEPPASSKVSFTMQSSGLRGENAGGLGFSLDGWQNLEPPQGSMAVIDFASPREQFARFRIVTLPPGAAMQPIRLPKLLLQADAGSLPASLAPSLASHIAKLVSQGGFLQLRPFLRTVGAAIDMVDALPPQFKLATANGKELDFTKLREVIGNDLAEKVRRQKEMETPAYLLSRAKRNAAQQPPQQGVRGQGQIAQLQEQVQKEAAIFEQTEAALTTGVAVDRNCLAMVPEGLEDMKLDHVSLCFVAGLPNKPGEKFELIRFEDPSAGVEERK